MPTTFVAYTAYEQDMLRQLQLWQRWGMLGRTLLLFDPARFRPRLGRQLSCGVSHQLQGADQIVVVLPQQERHGGLLSAELSYARETGKQLWFADPFRNYKCHAGLLAGDAPLPWAADVLRHRLAQPEPEQTCN